MKYRDFFLLESWKDYVVSTNPETLLYDFYVLSYLTTLNVDPTQKGYTGTFIGRDANEIKLDIKEAESRLLPALRDKLSEALFIAICAEIRHVIDNPQRWGNYKNNKLLTQYIRNYQLFKSGPIEFEPKRNVGQTSLNPKEVGYVQSFKAATKAIADTGSSREQFARLSADLFRNMRWSAAYGGEKWAQIAEAYLMLQKDPQSTSQLQIAIDHAYDLQHNTGAVLNKVKDYYIKGDIVWLQRALDFKANLRSVYQLLPKCSSDMRKLALEAFKAAGVKKGTLEKTTARGTVVKSDEERAGLSKKPSSVVDALSKKCRIVNPDGTLSKPVKVIGMYGTSKVVVAIPEKDQVKTQNFYIDELVWSDWNPVNKTKTSDEFKVGEKYIYEFENNKYEVELVRKTSLMVGPHEQVIVKILNYILINNEDKLKIGSKMATNTSYLKKLNNSTSGVSSKSKYKVGDVIAFPGYVFEIYKIFPDHVHLKVVKTSTPNAKLNSVVEYTKRDFEEEVVGKFKFLSIDEFKIGDKFKNIDTGEVCVVQTTTNRNIVIYTVVDVAAPNKDPLYKQINIKELVGNVEFLSKGLSDELPKADFSMGLEPEGDSEKNVGKFVEFNDSPILGGAKKLIFKGEIVGYDRSSKKYTVKVLTVTSANTEHHYDYSVGEVIRWNDDGTLKIVGDEKEIKPDLVDKNLLTKLNSINDISKFQALINQITTDNMDYREFKRKEKSLDNELYFKWIKESTAKIVAYDILNRIQLSIAEIDPTDIQLPVVNKLIKSFEEMSVQKLQNSINTLKSLFKLRPDLEDFYKSDYFKNIIKKIYEDFNTSYFKNLQALFASVKEYPINFYEIEPYMGMFDIAENKI